MTTKVITADKKDDLELKLMKWFASNSNANIKNILQSESSAICCDPAGNVSKIFNVTVTIFYS